MSISTPASAHALQPGYLELRLLNNDLYAVVWKVPEVQSRPMNITAVLPENCENRTVPDPEWDGNAFVSRWTTRCQGGLEGQQISIDNLGKTRTDVLVRYDFSDGSSETHRLTPDTTSFQVATQPSSMEVVRTYLVLGFQHILSGIDHLVFVLALLLLVKNLWRLVWTVTAFTVAHSLTLAGATLGIVNLPGPPIEAVIALSIMFVAAEIIHGRQGRPGLTVRYPWVVAFVFGLLHGFGFAGALTQIGLPENAIPMALLFFNLGVELGQLFFIAMAVAIMAAGGWLMQRLQKTPWPWAWLIPPYAIGSLSVFWVIERLASF
ncbi:MAG: HupE/UreJ family protein [Xanthomonadales bacterium]|nr:HupE/UreJ family protein [Xanthomonadales bacterium]